MKFTIILLALVAVIDSVAYAAPSPQDDGGEIQELLLALQQQNDQEKNENVDIQSLLESMQDDEEAQIEAEAQIEDAALQEFFAREQIPVKLQSWFSKAWKKVKKIVKKVSPYVKTGYKIYNEYKKYKG